MWLLHVHVIWCLLKILETKPNQANILNNILFSHFFVVEYLMSCRQFEISRRNKFTVISDEDLDTRVRQLTQGNVSIGQRVVMGLLKMRESQCRDGG